MNRKLFVKVDEDGKMVDVVMFDLEDIEGNEREIPSNLVPPNTEKRLFEPKWNFESEEWEESLSEEEVAERESEINSSENQPTLEERQQMLEDAILDLMFRQGGGF